MCAALLAGCIAEAWFARGTWPEEPTLVGGLVHRVLFPTPIGSNDSFWWDDGAVFKDETGRISVVILPPDEPMDDWINGLLTEHDSLLLLTHVSRTERTGLWQYCAATERSEIHCYRLQNAEGWSDADIARARALFVSEVLGGDEASDLSRRLSKGDVVTTRLRWLGILNDATAMALLVGAIASVPLSAKYWRRLFISRRRRRMAAGRCAACGYDLRGNESGVCPECGNPSEPRA